MWKRFRGVAVVAMAAWNMTSCNSDTSRAAAPVPEVEQVISASLKDLYIAASAAVPHSEAQQKVILRMAEKASNGKELLLVTRAAEGVFPASAPLASRVISLVTAKMMKVGTLDQLIEYATRYAVDSESTRPYVERMFQLAGEKSEPRIWYRIRLAAFHLRVGDLERQAQARGDQLAGR